MARKMKTMDCNMRRACVLFFTEVAAISRNSVVGHSRSYRRLERERAHHRIRRKVRVIEMQSKARSGAVHGSLHTAR
jgi:hypothetical protein